MTNPRILLLTGSSDFNRNTSARFIESDLNLVAIVEANKQQGGINFSYLKIAFKKYGLLKLLGQIAERINYKLKNSKLDAKIKETLLDKERNMAALTQWSGKRIFTDDYNHPEIIEFIKSSEPDFIVIHTPYWVGKTVREIPKIGIIGGHPGITPFYRGVHSPFWAIKNGETDKVGFSVFWVDKGVDTGDVIFQEKSNIDPSDSYVTLSWKGMINTCEAQINILKDYCDGKEIPRKKHDSIPEGSNYGHPTLIDYFAYRKIQKLVR